MPPRQLSLPNLAALKPFRSVLFLKLPPAGSAARRTTDLRDAIADFARDLRGVTVPVRSARSTKGELYLSLCRLSEGTSRSVDDSPRFCRRRASPSRCFWLQEFVCSLHVGRKPARGS